MNAAHPRPLERKADDRERPAYVMQMGEQGWAALNWIEYEFFVI